MIYIIMAGSWHLLSNVLLKRYAGSAEESLAIDTIKDWGFMILMAVLLHQILFRLLQKWERAMELRKEMENNLRRTERALKTISACNGALVRATNETMLLTEICRVVVEKGGYRLAWVGFAENDEKKTITVAARAGNDDGYLEKVNVSWSENDERGRGPTGTAIRTGEIVVCNDFQSNPMVAPWRAEAAKHGFGSIIVLPLCHAERSIGALIIYAAETNAFNPEEVELLHELAGDLGFGIQALRTKAEHERAEAEQQLFRTLIERSIDGILLVDPATGRFLDASESACKSLGFSRDELLTLSAFDVAVGLNQAVFDATNAEIERAGSVTLETLHRRKDGTTFPVETSLSPVTLDREYLVVITRDITRRKREAEALQQERNLLRTLIDNIPDKIYVRDISNRFILANASFARLMGVAGPAALIGKKDADFYPAEMASDFDSIDQRVFAGHESLSEERLLHFPNGQELVMLTTKVPFRNEKGEVIGLIGVGHDITEHKRAEKILRESEKKFAKTFHASPMPMWLSTIQEGRFLDVNDEFLTLLQRPREDVIGHTSFELDVWTDAKQRVDILTRHKTRGSVRNVELGMHTKSGELRSILWSVEEVEISGESCWLGSALDITEHKRAEEQVHLQSAALTAAANAIMITDQHGKIEWVNPAFIRLTGYSAAEVMGANPRLLKSGQHPPGFYASLWATIVTGNVWHGELINRRKDGQLYTEDTTITPVRDADGQIGHFVAIKQDVTERKLLENQLRQSQKMEAIGQLAGGVAHDFNNLLTVIGGNASMLLQDVNLQTAEASECVQQIVEASERAAGLTRQLLTFSRRQVIQPRRLDLNEVVAQMTKLLQRILGEDISLVANYAASLPDILADTGMMEQILLNLAVNSRDAMPKGGKLTITTSAEILDAEANGQNPGTPAGLYVLFTVADTGCGIPPEVLPHIFEPFFTTKDVGKGTGLGLATVHGIVQQHNGRIAVTSEINRGTKFHIHFPAMADATSEKKTGTATPALPRGSETILLVEDESIVSLTISNMLQRLGYTVLLAGSGVEALKVWRTHRNRIQLLLTDIVMPDGMNGYELGRQLQDDNLQLKVVYSSGYTGSHNDKRQTMVEGVNFLQKPYPAQKLAEILRKSLDQK